MPAKQFDFYDSVDPQTIPAGQIVATYATGARPVPTSLVAGRKTVLWIDTLGNDYSAQVVDVEPGAVTPAAAASWAQHRLSANSRQLAIIYTSLGEWSSVQADVASLPAKMRSRIRWWVADPTGSRHIVPGSQATQWSWGSNYDISTALPGF